MRIALLTRRAGFNHGSSLQAYAIKKLIERYAEKVTIINYDEFSQHPKWKLRPIIENIFSKFPLKNVFFSQAFRRYLKIRGQQYIRFKEFENKYIAGTGRKLSSSKELLNFCESFDAVVCGSDQIWHPNLFDSNFLLGFIPDDSKIKKIAYAPSIGINRAEYLPEIEVNLIKRIDYLSCREEEGSKIISSLTGRKVATVLDPTLMLSKEEWLEITSSRNVPKDKYILCYFLGPNIPIEFVNNLKSESSLRTIDLLMFNRQHECFGDFELTDCGPEDFLGLIKNAEYICTDSFHATVFSLIFNKKVFTFERFKKQSIENQNSRIYNLCKKLGCEDIITNDNHTTKLLSFDYNSIENKINENRLISSQFLSNALGSL